MNDYQIRMAESDQDKAHAYRLRYDLYVAEQGLFQDTADHERRWLREETDAHAFIWLAVENDTGEIIGTSRLHRGDAHGFDRETRESFDLEAFTDIVEEPDMGVVSRMLVRPAYRGTPLVSELSVASLTYAVSLGMEILFGECEPHLINRWGRLGFRSYGLCEHPINGTLVRIALVLGDLEYVQKIGSPLAPIMAGWSRPRATAMALAKRLYYGQNVVSEFDDRERFWAAVAYTLPRHKLARLLGNLSDEELEVLLRNGHALDCRPGSLLIRKGHVSRTLYILLTGSLVVRDDGETIVEVNTPGEILGEVAVFSGGDRMSDVLAGNKGARVLALSERNLSNTIADQGAAAAKFLLHLTRGLCTKLRQRST